jgi:hypothetical protein
VRRLRVEVELELDSRIPLPDGYIVTALADALPEMDEQGLLFPGIDWPRHAERLRDWQVTLVGAGMRARPVSRLDQAIEVRRRDGDFGPRDSLPEAVEELLAAIDDLEPQVLMLSERAWRAVMRLRWVAASLAGGKFDPSQLAAVMTDARRIINAAATLVRAAGTEEEHVST